MAKKNPWWCYSLFPSNDSLQDFPQCSHVLSSCSTSCWDSLSYYYCFLSLWTGNFSFTPKVIPDSVPESSFRIKGNSSGFHITWSPPTNVEWGTVFYCVGSKALQVRIFMPSLLIIYVYYCIYLLMSVFSNRNTVCFFSSIYKPVKQLN